jgi:glycosyltransferase involved in cell wall biosynthesis
MKILYDHQIFTLQKYGGISRYFSNIIENITLLGLHDVKMSLFISENEYNKYGYKPNCIPTLDFKGKSKLYNFVNNINTKKDLLIKNFDVFHPTFYDTYYLNLLDTKPFVLTVHDMTDELVVDRDQKSRVILQKKMLIKKAKKIIAVSKNTKNDIIKIYPDINPDKIVVSYHATTLSNFDLKLKNLEIRNRGRYILFVGNRDGYKNFLMFVREIATILLSYEDVYLVCAGGGVFNMKELLLLKQLNLTLKVKYVKFNSDQELQSLYSQALCFVFPSLYEGFGIPILESFACGCPTILNRTSSLPEIGGDAALYFSFQEKDSLLNQLVKIINNDSFRNKMIDAGYERLKLFSWSKTIKEHLKIYESCL